MKNNHSSSTNASENAAKKALIDGLPSNERDTLAAAETASGAAFHLDADTGDTPDDDKDDQPIPGEPRTGPRPAGCPLGRGRNCRLPTRASCPRKRDANAYCPFEH